MERLLTVAPPDTTISSASIVMSRSPPPRSEPSIRNTPSTCSVRSSRAASPSPWMRLLALSVRSPSTVTVAASLTRNVSPVQTWSPE